MATEAVRLEIEYPEKLSRGLLLLKTFFGWAYVGIPFGFFLYFYLIAVAAVGFAAWWIILVTGKYPKGLFNFVVSFLRWINRVYAYIYLMRDEYPSSRSAVRFEIEHPQKLSRGLLLLKTFFGWAYVGIPHYIILFFYSIAVSVITFIAFWIILFTGRYPKGLFDFVVGEVRWYMRVLAYLGLLRDEYPPFTGRAQAKQELQPSP